MRPRPKGKLLRLSPPIFAAVSLLAAPTALAGPSPDTRHGSGPAPDPYPAATTTHASAPVRPAPVTPRQVTTAPRVVIVRTVPVAPPARAVVVPPARTTPARTTPRHRHRAAPPPKTVVQRVVDVEPLRVDVAAGLGAVERAGHGGAVLASIALLLAALAATSGGVLVLTTRELA
jgi:hypothetical protein